MWRLSIHLSLFLLSAIGLSAEAYANDLPSSSSAAPVVVDAHLEKTDSSLPAQAEHAPPLEAITVAQTDALTFPELPPITQPGATATAPGTAAAQKGTTAATPGAEATPGGTVTTPLPATEPSESIPTGAATTPAVMTQQAGENNAPPNVIKKSSLPYQVITVLVFDVLSIFFHIW